MTIQFPCPLCHHTLKAPEEKSGAAISCPRCGERSVIPSAGRASSPTAARAGVAGGDAGAAPGRLRAWRALVALVVAVGVLSLLLAVLGPALRFSEDSAAAVRGFAWVTVPLCVVALLALLHGHMTGCPGCGRPWAREEGETECLGREEFHKAGESWVRAKRRVNYACKHCQHKWSATLTDEYKGNLRGRRGAKGA